MKVVLRAAAGLVMGFGLMASVALGQSLQTLPPAFDTVAGGTGNSLPIANYTSGTQQVIYGADQLAGIPVGSVITGMQLRLRNSDAAFPAAAFSASRYDVRLAGSSLTPATMSSTFATNMTNPILVRSGSLDVSAGAYPGTGNPRAWGPVIGFTTGYVYKGGPLVIEWRVVSPSNTFAAYADLVNAGTANRYMYTDNNPDAATATTLTPTAGGPIVRLTFTPPPADLAKGVTKVIVADRLADQTNGDGDGVLLWISAYSQVAVAGANQFDTIGPGSDFVGMTWRLWSQSGSAWPLAVANFGQFDVQLSKSNNGPGALSKTIASNVGADAVMVRSGALSLPIGDFALKGSSATAPFGAEVGFASAYHYRGGPLLTVVRNTGQGSGSPGYMDCLNVGGPGYNTDVQAWQEPSYGVAVATLGSPYLVTKYSVDAGTSSPLNQPSPAPGGLSWEISQLIQTVISASELQYIPVGSVIDSLWLRQSAGAGVAGPGADVTATDFELALSSATNQPSDMSTTVAANEGADRVLVYDGALGVPAGVMPPGSNGNYGKIVQFQKQFVYKGGPLCVTIRHTGLSGALDTLDAVLGTTATNRTIYSYAVGAPTGSFFGAGYSGTAMKLGYIPSVMAPNNIATAEGSSAWNMPHFASYAVQTIIAASELRTMDVGSLITGLSLRNDSTFGGASFPSVDTNVAQFDVSIAPAARSPLTMSATYATNIGPGEIVVRSGPMTVPANAFPASGSALPSQNAWYVPFTRVFRYEGGDLCVTIRGQGTTGTGANNYDGDSSFPLARGASVFNYSSSGAASGSFWGPLGIRLAFTPRAFCRADLNNDGLVDDADFVIFVAAYNTLDCNDPSMPAGCPADLNFDRVVDDADFVIFLAAYNELVCP